MRRLRFSWTTLFAYTSSADKKFIAVTDFGDASDAKVARMMFELLDAHTDFRCAWGYQLVESEGGTITTVEKGSTENGDGRKVPSLVSVSADTDGKARVRWGFLVWSAAGSPTLICARVAGVTEYGRV